MLKMYINDEEVVSNKDFTISEELLVASSTVLNNCYPLTWEQTKDYVNNFYYPKDYSKCRIYNVNEGDIEILGSTTQNVSKNIMPNNKASGTSAGVTFTANNDGTYLVNGQNNSASANSYLYISPLSDFNLKAGTYYSISSNDNNCQVVMYCVNSDNTTVYKSMANEMTFTKDVKQASFYVQVRKGTTTIYDNFKLYPILSVTPVTKETYEPYAEPLSPSNPIPIINKTGIITENIGGKDFTIDLGDIELCKIGSYQDKIYYNRNNNKWYLHKETKKQLLSAISFKTEASAGTNNYRLVSLTAINDAIKPIDNNEVAKALCNYYEAKSALDTWNNITGISLSQSKKIYIKDSNFNSQSDTEAYNAWVADNNVIMYYALSTPVETEITDEALLSQLNGLLQQLLFVGIVKNSADISLKPTEPKYCSLQILDFKTLLSEGDLLDFVISNKTIEQAIEMVIEKIANYGFVKGNVQILGADNIIGAYSTLDKTPYDVFQYLAEISQSIWFTRTIDENTTAIDFYDPTLMPRKENLQYNAEYWKNNGIKNVSFAYGTYDYRNKQVILSDEVFSDIDTTDTIIADGYSKQFTVLNNIGQINSITVNGASRTIATNEDKELGIVADFYYSVGGNTLESNDNDPAYSAGSIILVNYVALVKGRQIVYNQNEVNRVSTQLNRNGIISRYEDRNDVLSSSELNKIAQTYIRYKGNAEIILTVETLNNDLYNIGDVVFFEAPINELQLEYLVKKKSINIINTGNYRNIFYTYELSSSFNGENAINWFDNQRSKATGNISSGDYITRNIDNEETANIIFKNLNIVELEVEGDNVLNAPLNSPLIK